MSTDITKKEVIEIINNEIPPYHASWEKHKALAQALLDAWAALHTIVELTELRSDVNGFKAVAKTHLPEDYSDKE